MRALLLAHILVFACGGVHAQEAADAIGRPTSEPYKGDLAIFEDPKREKDLQIERVMDLLAIKSGARVADIGAGSGWFTVRAARRVGKSGAVYAVEINPGYVEHIKNRAARERLDNIRATLGRPEDPLLRRESIDAVMLLKTYHEVAEPIRLLRRVRAAMRPGALLGVIDRKGDGGNHGLNAAVVIKEAARAGFSLVKKYDFVKSEGADYFLIFR